jgi:hypothetical protein
MRREYWLPICLFAVLTGFAGCSDLPAGPSLDAIAVSNIGVQSTVGDSSLCCCHVVATARNNNSVPVHATFKFAVLDASQQELARTVYFIENFRPGQTSNITAEGFLFECNRVQSVKYELSVRGLTTPGS